MNYWREELDYDAEYEYYKEMHTEQQYEFVLEALNSEFVKHSDSTGSWISTPLSLVKALGFYNKISEKSCLSNDEQIIYLSVPDDSKLLVKAGKKFMADPDWDISIGVSVESESSVTSYMKSFKPELIDDELPF